MPWGIPLVKWPVVPCFLVIAIVAARLAEIAGEKTLSRMSPAVASRWKLIDGLDSGMSSLDELQHCHASNC